MAIEVESTTGGDSPGDLWAGPAGLDESGRADVDVIEARPRQLLVQAVLRVRAPTDVPETDREDQPVARTRGQAVEGASAPPGMQDSFNAPDRLASKAPQPS